MSDVRAYRTADIPAVPSAARAKAIWQRATRDVFVEIVDATALADMRAAWDDLVARADSPNVFMDPALMQVAAQIAPRMQHRSVLVWKSIGGRRQLAGAWSFAIRRPRQSVLPVRMLAAPVYEHCYLSTPVIDRNCLDETIEAMLDAIDDDPQLPKIVALDMMATDGATYNALARALARRDSEPRVFAQLQRPKLASDLDGKAYLEKAQSGSSRKKLRQHRRKLAEKGDLTSVVATQPGAVCRALEEFLAMEASGWKGRQGTALQSSKADAAFMRGTVGALASTGCASIHSLYLDGKPVSMQIVVRSGAVAFTWKTAYDEAFQDFSPGTLLWEDYTAALLADKTIAAVDSCSFDDSGYMATWTERQAMADLWFDVRRGGSAAFRFVGGAQGCYRAMRALAKTGYLAWRNRQKARKRS
jgi:CelD/BcsL family acetyltransferase involved in cellulose biosynthesis